MEFAEAVLLINLVMTFLIIISILFLFAKIYIFEKILSRIKDPEAIFQQMFGQMSQPPQESKGKNPLTG